MKSYLSLDPFVPWTREERPIRWPQKFGREAELCVEIGFGLGDFLVREAREHPRRDFVGIEPTWVLVRRALRKIGLAGVKNVKILQMDAWVALERVFGEGTVHGVFSLFPCPWPKRKHLKNRLFSRRFLMLLNSRMAEGGWIRIVTDDGPYMEWILSQLPETGLEGGVRAISPKFGTKYEKKWQELGRKDFYEVSLTKKNSVPFPTKEEPDLRIRYAEHFDPEGFSPEGESGEIAVEFKDFLYDAGRKRGMVRTVVSEGNLFQDFWIEIARVDRRWRIRPARGCGLIPTAGAQRALDLTSRRIEEGPKRG